MPYMSGQEPAAGDRVQVMHEQVDGLHRWPPVGREGTVIRVPSVGRDTLSVRFEDCGDFNLQWGLRQQDQIVWSCKTDRLDPVGDPAFYLVEPHEGSFRPIPDGPTFSDGKRAADRAKQMTAERGVRIQVRPIAKDIATSGWREREERRLSDGTYTPMPKGWDLPLIDGHVLHLAKEDPKMVAFTESPEKGVLDRQTKVTPGRYIERFHLGLSEAQKARYVALVDKPETLHFTDSGAKIEWVYRHGPDSCMAHSASSYRSEVHPVRVYAGGDLTLAYLLKDDGKRASARCLVWKSRKIHGRIYGDSARMEKALDALGYTSGGYDAGKFAGAKLTKIWDEENKTYVMPYLDGYSYASDTAFDDKDGFLTIVSPDQGSKNGSPGDVLVTTSQNGFGDLYRWCPGQRRFIHNLDDFVTVHGQEHPWSISAARDTCERITDPETGAMVWWPRDQLVLIGSVYRTRASVEGLFFVSDHSGQAFESDELHTLEDGRKVSRGEFRALSFTCAGSGRTSFGRGDRMRIGQRQYSRTWVQEQATQRGIDLHTMVDRLEVGDIDGTRPRSSGEIRVGDRVRYLAALHYGGPGNGTIGTVRTASDWYDNYDIEFEGWRGGHTYGPDGDSGWNVNRGSIELVEDTEAPSIAA